MMRVAVVGSYGVGETMLTKRFPGPGETVAEGILSVGHGGKGSNQAVATRRLGAEVSLLTAVGEDAAAEAAIDLWRREGIDASQVLKVEGAKTMTGMIIVDDEAENRIVIAPGALDHLSAADVRERSELIESADALIVCLEIPIDAASEALRIGREAGVLTVFNPAPARPVPRDIFDSVDVMTPNLSEARTILGSELSEGGSGPTDGATELALALYVSTGCDVVLTNGGDGSIVADSQGARVVAPHPPAELVDTTGAGDSFTGALTVALVEGDDLETAAERAAEVGAFVVARPEVIPSLPQRSELSDLLWPTSGRSSSDS
jgi:ribokinase